MPGVDPRGMAPPLLGLEPAKIFLINSPVAIRLFLCDRARGAPAAPPGTPHANRGHCPQRRWPRRPCMPPALRARRLGEPRHHHDIIVGVLGFLSLSVAVSPRWPHQPGSRPGSAPSGRRTFRLRPRRTFSAALRRIGTSPSPRSRSIPATPPRGVRQPPRHAHGGRGGILGTTWGLWSRPAARRRCGAANFSWHGCPALDGHRVTGC